MPVSRAMHAYFTHLQPLVDVRAAQWWAMLRANFGPIEIASAMIDAGNTNNINLRAMTHAMGIGTAEDKKPSFTSSTNIPASRGPHSCSTTSIANGVRDRYPICAWASGYPVAVLSTNIPSP
jgi:hypothetical protein